MRNLESIKIELYKNSKLIGQIKKIQELQEVFNCYSDLEDLFVKNDEDRIQQNKEMKKILSLFNKAIIEILSIFRKEDLFPASSFICNFLYTALKHEDYSECNVIDEVLDNID